MVADTYLPANRWASGKQLGAQIRAEHSNGPCTGFVLGADETAFGHFKAAHRNELRCHAVDGAGGTTCTRLHHLVAVDLRGDALDAGNLGGDRFSVLQHEGLGSRCSLSTGVVVARNHEQHVGAEVGQLLLRQPLSTTTNSDQGDH